MSLRSKLAEAKVMKTRKGSLKREAILAAAARVFSEKGYEASMAEVGIAAGTHAGSIYYYFPSKEALAEEVLNIGTTSVSGRVMDRIAALPHDIGPYERIRAALDEHLDQMLRKDDFVVAYWKLIDQVPDDLKGRHLRHPRAYGRFWTKLIADGQAAGVLRPDLDPKLTQLLLLGSTIYALDWFRPSGKLSPRGISEALADIFFLGTVPRKGKPQR
jgi:AcrR family transcriptional regulator